MSARILIVEDQARIALGLQRQLISLGHQVVGIAGNARDALKDASDLKPDLIFMDIGLEGDIDGICGECDSWRREYPRHLSHGTL
jgi:two-component system cell cycle sensor histidine kinase/response regulator CckA